MTRCYSLCIILCYLACNVQSSKILAVFPMPAHSHFSVVFRLAKELADRGHQVTAISPYPQKVPIKNYRDISVEENVKAGQETLKTICTIAHHTSFFEKIKVVFELGQVLTEQTFKNQDVKKLMNSNETFDLVLIEQFLVEALVGLGYHFKAPIVFVSPTETSTLSSNIFANPTFSSYIPHQRSSFVSKMNFWERTQNLLYNVIYDVLAELFYFPIQRAIFKKYIKTHLKLDDVLRNVSLMLANSHVSVNNPVPYVPSIIEIGGYHINPSKKLPRDLQAYLDESNEGVVLFSMGSNFKSKDLKPETRQAILNAFSKIKQKVLWKFKEDLLNKPKNVKIMKWLPQQDVLAHPNVKAFITHGGCLSNIETVYFGKPAIGIAIFGDQNYHIANAVNKGYAVSVPLAKLSEENLYSALQEILNNPKYTEAAKKRSVLMHDRPMKPIDVAVYWIEHVIRYKGAPHLRNAGIDLTWYQRNLLDVFVFFALVTVALITTSVIVIKKIARFIWKKRFFITKSKKYE